MDDHDVFRDQVRKLLEAEGFEVVGDAASATSGMQLVRSEQPDLVLLDVMLPDAMGFDVVPSLRELGSFAIVLTSSRDRSDYGSRIESSGADGFIPKDQLSGAGLRAFVA
ncbi:response regulator transcription factor [Rathayibacter sp. YIM 133350]|uniref:response regulator n=1 Tax=Rathayibacter sp. YIM 133350 TaxID=3131992 RepID=UPI00307DDACA